MTSSADLIRKPFLLPVCLKEKSKTLHKQSDRKKKKILMVDKYFITET